MTLAAPRDRIAYQYANEFCDIFDLGLNSLERARQESQDEILSTLTVYLTFLSSFLIVMSPENMVRTPRRGFYRKRAALLRNFLALQGRSVSQQP